MSEFFQNIDIERELNKFPFVQILSSEDSKKKGAPKYNQIITCWNAYTEVHNNHDENPSAWICTDGEKKGLAYCPRCKEGGTIFDVITGYRIRENIIADLQNWTKDDVLKEVKHYLINKYRCGADGEEGGTVASLV